MICLLWPCRPKPHRWWNLLTLEIIWTSWNTLNYGTKKDEQPYSRQWEILPGFKSRVHTRMSCTFLKGFWLTWIIFFINRLYKAGYPFNQQQRNEKCYWRHRPSQKWWVFLFIFWWLQEFWYLRTEHTIVLRQSRKWQYLFQNGIRFAKWETAFQG